MRTSATSTATLPVHALAEYANDETGTIGEAEDTFRSGRTLVAR